jgi:type III secretory pathway component EscT
MAGRRDAVATADCCSAISSLRVILSLVNTGLAKDIIRQRLIISLGLAACPMDINPPYVTVCGQYYLSALTFLTIYL